MTYDTNADLPASVQDHLPIAAQNIYRREFNYAFLTYAGHPDREEIAVRLAWAAVKRSFVEHAGSWTPSAPTSGHG
jgi:cation transport regulator